MENSQYNNILDCVEYDQQIQKDTSVIIILCNIFQKSTIRKVSYTVMCKRNVTLAFFKTYQGCIVFSC